MGYGAMQLVGRQVCVQNHYNLDNCGDDFLIGYLAGEGIGYVPNSPRVVHAAAISRTGGNGDRDGKQTAAGHSGMAHGT